jgi:hypothetical protein
MNTAIGSVTSKADDLSAFISIFQRLTELDLIITRVGFGREVNRVKQLSPKLRLPNLQYLGLYKVYCSAQDLGALILRHQESLESITLVRVEVTDGIRHWRTLFALIRHHLSKLRLSITSCTTGRVESHSTQSTQWIQPWNQSHLNPLRPCV